MFDLDPLDQLLRGDSIGLRLEHDRRAVRVVAAHVVARMAAKFLKPDPDVGLHGFQDVAQMQRAIGIKQRAGDENSAWLGHAKLCHERVQQWRRGAALASRRTYEASLNCSNLPLLMAFL